MIYGINGGAISAAYDINGNPLAAAYDIDGQVIYSAATPDAKDVKVMSYNVGQWYTGTGVLVPDDKASAYYALQTGMISRIKSDILFAQEYTRILSGGVTAISALCKQYPYMCGVDKSGSSTQIYYGRAVFSKYPLSNYTTHIYANSAFRYIDTVTAHIDGEDIHLINTHLGLQLTEREAQIAELIDYIKSLDGHFILCGDLNMTSNATWEEAYSSIVAPMLAEGWHLASGETKAVTTYYGDGSNLLALDNIISDLPISDVYTDTTKLTDDISDKIDHVPLVATVTIGT